VAVTAGDAAEFLVSLSNPYEETVTVQYATLDGTARADKDFQAAEAMITFLPGETIKTLSVPTFDKGAGVGEKDFSVVLSNPQNAELAEARAEGTIAPRLGPPLKQSDLLSGGGDVMTMSAGLTEVSITDATGWEDQNLTFSVWLSEASSATVTVQWHTEDGTARADDLDYTPASGPPLTFSAGQIVKLIQIPALRDWIDEYDEHFSVVLSGATNASIEDGEGVGTILDIDPQPTLSINNVEVQEGDQGTRNATFTVTLSGRTDKTVTVYCATSQIDATPGVDYTTRADTLTFPPDPQHGSRQQQFTVPILGDTTDEPDEQFRVTLSNPTNATISDNEGIGTITDDDLPIVRIESVQDAEEGAAAGRFRLHRNTTFTGLTVEYAINTYISTATNGVDFPYLPGTGAGDNNGSVTFPTGQAYVDLVVDPTGSYDDILVEGTEGIGIYLIGGGIQYNIGSPSSGWASITENEAPEFDDPDDHYDFTLGEGSPEHTTVGLVHATDPEGDDVTYEITGGDPDGLFTIGSDATLKLAKDLDVGGPDQYVLDLRATDTAGNHDIATATITMKPLVVITGDLQGVEDPPGSAVDNITLEFIRISDNIENELEVEYSVTWTSAAPADLDNPEDLTGTIHIPAGQDRASITLIPKDDAVVEGMEEFSVKVVETSDYVSLRGEPVNLKDKKLGFYGRETADVQILDEVTLFGRFNADPIRDDTNPDGVAYNDIDQGAIGDCYFGAAVAALAFRDPDFVHDNVFEVKPDGTVSVYFFPVLGQTGEAAQEVNIELTLDKGWAQAELSRDRADGDSQGAYEVWTIALEKAYGQFIGRSDLVDGGSPANVWDHITGEPANTEHADQYTNEQLVTMIQSAFTSGQKVVLGTRDLPGDKKKGELAVVQRENAARGSFLRRDRR